MDFAQFLPSQRFKHRESLVTVAGVLERVGLPTERRSAARATIRFEEHLGLAK